MRLNFPVLQKTLDDSLLNHSIKLVNELSFKKFNLKLILIFWILKTTDQPLLYIRMHPLSLKSRKEIICGLCTGRWVSWWKLKNFILSVWNFKVISTQSNPPLSYAACNDDYRIHFPLLLYSELNHFCYFIISSGHLGVDFSEVYCWLS